MPIYEYDCSDCGHHFDFLARTRQDKPLQCPACGAKKLDKRLSTFSPSVAPSGTCKSCAAQPACPNARSGGCCGGGFG